MTATRYLYSAPAGLLASTVLLWLMQALIASGPEALTTPPPRFVLDWVRLPPPPAAPPEAPVPDRIRPPLPPPPREEAGPGDGIEVWVPPTVSAPQAPGFDALDFGQDTSPLVAVMNVQPTYPAGAAARGLEGFVTVRFDVTELGTVTNVVVVEASHRLFEGAAIEAARRTRYRPAVTDGVARATTGVYKRYTFRLDE